MTSWKTKTAPVRRQARQGVAAHRQKPVVAALGRVATGQSELSFVSGGNGQAKGRLDGILDLGAADQLGDQTADRGRVETEEPVGAGIGEEQAAAEVDGDHGLGHGSQDHEKLLPVLIQPGGPGLDFVRGRVEGPHQPADRAPRHGQDGAYFLPRAERLQAARDLGERRPPAPDHVSDNRRPSCREDYDDDLPSRTSSQLIEPSRRSRGADCAPDSASSSIGVAESTVNPGHRRAGHRADRKLIDRAVTVDFLPRARRSGRRMPGDRRDGNGCMA